MGQWFGDDGQVYDSWDKWRGANNRYRQQQEQNKLLEKQNELLEKQANAQNRLLEEQEFEKRQEIIERKKQQEEEQIRFMEDMLLCTDLPEETNLDEIKKMITRNINGVYDYFKCYIDNMIIRKKEIIETYKKHKESKPKSTFDKTMNEMDLDNDKYDYKEIENKYIERVNVVEDVLEQRRKLNINFCDELYERLYSDIINYHKKEIEKITQPIELQNECKTDEVGEREKKIRENHSEYILKCFELFKKLILRLKEIEEKEINYLKKQIKDFETDIEVRKEQISKLNQITTLKDLKQIKENVIDIDYEFSSEIISDLYSVDEVVLMIKRHIKELEIELSNKKEKEKYYKLIDYLVNNETYTNLQEYKTYDSDVDYEEEYNRILKLEEERKEEQIKLEEEKKIREEEQRKLEEEKKRKKEEQRKLDKEKQNKKREEDKKQKTLELYNKKKKYISEYKGCNTTFAIFSIICSAYLPMLPIYIIIWFCFAKALEPKKRYLKNIKNLGFDFNSIEEFEKYILDKGLVKEIENIQYGKQHSNKYYTIWLIICLILFLIFYSVLPTLVVFIVLNINGLVKNKKMEKMKN